MDVVGQDPRSWRLATESIVVRIRWFGVLMGLVLVQARSGLADPAAVRWFLRIGAGYALLDTLFYRSGRVFLERWPLFVSAIEAVFIALLCYYDVGLDSPFRWYYLLSLICAAIRYRPVVAWVTFGLDGLSLLGLTWAVGGTGGGLAAWGMTMVILAWATWATLELASLLKGTGERLRVVNVELERNRLELEQRVEERTEALRASQARVLHQEKVAAFGLLAAGIAHEVGNPLAALSSLVQMLQRRGPDPYTAEKLELAGSQLERIRRTIRELVDFSRPASTLRTKVRAGEVVDEALGIAKYYHGTKMREVTTEVDPQAPVVLGVRDHLTQVVLNLLINAIDATERGGRIGIVVEARAEGVELRVSDDGRGIAVEDQEKVFQPYFTTKRQGTGLGLYVCKQIVEEHGGSITFESGGEQGGSVFRIWLPAAAASAAVTVLPQAVSSEVSVSG